MLTGTCETGVLLAEVAEILSAEMTSAVVGINSYARMTKARGKIEQAMMLRRYDEATIRRLTLENEKLTSGIAAVASELAQGSDLDAVAVFRDRLLRDAATAAIP